MSDLFQPGEVKIELVDSQPGGGQRVYPRPMGVRATHIETKTVAECWLGRSQHIQREIALDMLASALTHPRVR
jgi:protein subunit release factor A